MTELHLPWLEASIFGSLLGAIFVDRLHKSGLARLYGLIVAGFSLICASTAWIDFQFLHAAEASDPWHLMSNVLGAEIFTIDGLSAPLLPMTALLYFLTILTTSRTKTSKFSFSWTLASESILLATFCCRQPWWIIGLLAAGTVPPWLEMRARGKSTRIYVLHMTLFICLMIAGWCLVESEKSRGIHSTWAIVPLLGAVLVRCGIVPFHCWVTDLFEHATYGTSLLFITPIVGAYATVRLVLPISPDWVLRSMGGLSLFTAVYAAGMGLIQQDARRFLAYLLLSHSALVLVGLEIRTPIALTGALCVWMSIALASGGLGLTLRALESRYGRLSLTDYQGHYLHTPDLAMCFLLTGLASVGFPGTYGFVGTELLIDSAIETYPYVGIAVVLAETLNGITVMQAYFRLFTGTEYISSIPLRIRTSERIAVVAVIALILFGGFFPQLDIAGRYRAAEVLLLSHERNSGR